jgi:hypothetical protein
MRAALIPILVAALFNGAPRAAHGCSGRPVEKKTYYSENGEYSLEVDPSWDEISVVPRPLLTLRRAGEELWSKEASAFQSFRLPLDVRLSNDGKWLVFGGVSVHNISFDTKYEEGLRFYRENGRLIRFVSRRDLPVGEYGVSTAFWYDEQRTRIVGTELHFFTPGRNEPLLFSLETGAVTRGRLTPGEGDDSHWREQFRKP